MIENLTKAHLAYFGISEIQLNTTNYRLFHSDIKNAKVIYVSRSEGKIYTDSDYYKSNHYYNYRGNDFDNKNELRFPADFPASIPDYYHSKLIMFLHQKNVDYDLYDVTFKTRIFITDEIKKYELNLKCYKSKIVTLQANKLLEFEQHIETNEIYFDYLENQYKQLEKESTEKSPTIDPQKTLFDFIKNVKDIGMFMQDLKKDFPYQEGKKIKAVLDCLEENNVLEIPYGEFSSFYTVLSEYLEGSIVSRQGIYMHKLNIIADEKLINSTADKLKPLIDKYKKQ